MIASMKLFLTEEYRSVFSERVFGDSYKISHLAKNENTFVKIFKEYAEQALLTESIRYSGLIPRSKITKYRHEIVLSIRDGASYYEVTSLLTTLVANDIVNNYINRIKIDEKLIKEFEALELMLEFN